jgi:ABC-2 type transport system ATP-binding protein
VIAARALGKVFHPPGSVRDLLRGRLHGAPVTALSGVSFDVAEGEVVALMGENGAGKTTLLRILAGLLSPSSGQAQVAGQDAARAGPSSTFRREVALVVADERSFLWALTGLQNLLYFAALHGLSDRVARARAQTLLERVGLQRAGARRYAEYSRGMRQRLALARGLLGEPRVMLLDEPTLGLDPAGALDLRRFLREEVLRAAGRTAIVGSNDPAEVRLLADRVLFLREGRLQGQAPPADLERHLGLAPATGLPA